MGDPYDRTLNSVEEDPLIPQRMMDITKNVICKDVCQEFNKCCDTMGIRFMFSCTQETEAFQGCMKEQFGHPEVHAAVIEEYLNERSHYRTTGVRQRRYMNGQFIPRDIEKEPPLDKNGKYRYSIETREQYVGK